MLHCIMYSLYIVIYCIAPVTPSESHPKISVENPLSTPREMQTNMEPLDDQFIGNKHMNHEHPAFRLPSLTLEIPLNIDFWEMMHLLFSGERPIFRCVLRLISGGLSLPDHYVSRTTGKRDSEVRRRKFLFCFTKTSGPRRRNQGSF